MNQIVLVSIRTTVMGILGAFGKTNFTSSNLLRRIQFSARSTLGTAQHQSQIILSPCFVFHVPLFLEQQENQRGKKTHHPPPLSASFHYQPYLLVMPLRMYDSPIPQPMRHNHRGGVLLDGRNDQCGAGHLVYLSCKQSACAH